MYSLLQKATLFVVNVILVLALLLFASGFFPHKALLPGLAQWSERDCTGAIDAQFDRVVFMVVDALRSDFVFSNASHFHFTQSLVRAGAALPFTGHASPPTITMPRVKAITTGSVPSFVDLVLNFAESDDTSTLSTQDSWLAQLKAKGDRGLVMYGDDTWLRLFPGFFRRADGTTSFFVSDFTEVDNNVTRHVPDELAEDDWSVMIMHYLGLDHIGHKTGPRSPYMAPKQMEMDRIVHQIYSAIETQPHLQSTLLVLCGDHGMNEAGNHGGSATGETSTALLFISPSFNKHFSGSPCPGEPSGDYNYYETVEQSDIAPTLAALLGFPIPLNNLGVFIPNFLDLWKDDKKKVDIIHANVLQVLDIARGTFTSSPVQASASSIDDCAGSETERLLCQGEIIASGGPFRASQGVDVERELRVRLEWLRKTQSALSGTASNYDLDRMFLGLSLSFVALVFTAVMSYPILRQAGSPGLAFAGILLAYGAIHFASSYVEEEQQFWYWTFSGWLSYLYTKQQRKPSHSRYPRGLVVLAIAILFRLIRRWNQTGQKFAGEPDIVKFLSHHTLLLWFLITASYAVPSRRLCRAAKGWSSSADLSLLPVPVTMMALLFKISFTAADAPELLSGIQILDPLVESLKAIPLAVQARAVFVGLTVLLALALFAYRFRTPTSNTDTRDPETVSAFPSPPSPQTTTITIHPTLHSLLTLLLLTQSRPTNIPLFLLFSTIHYFLPSILTQPSSSSTAITTTSLSLTSLLLSQTSWFSLGNSNAISSIDLSNAYNGVTSYHVLVVGFLTLLSNWAGPVFWVSAFAELRASASARRRHHPKAEAEARRALLAMMMEQQQQQQQHFVLMTLFAATATTAVMAACWALREHLFVWTVFSPKFLFACAWLVGGHLVFEGGSAGVLGLLGGEVS